MDIDLSKLRKIERALDSGSSNYNLDKQAIGQIYTKLKLCVYCSRPEREHHAFVAYEPDEKWWFKCSCGGQTNPLAPFKTLEEASAVLDEHMRKYARSRRIHRPRVYSGEWRE